MSTTHYEFPTINGSDAINGVDAINGLANAVDTALYAVDSAVSGQASDIQTALNNAASASAAAGAASTNAAAAQASATAAQNSATAAVNTANATATNLNTFEQLFNLTPQTVTSGLGMTGISYSLTLAQDSTGSIFKFYGNMDKPAGTASSVTRVAIPGGSGEYAYGCATGLFLNNAPEIAYVVDPAGIFLLSNTTPQVTNLSKQKFAVGTDGQIYVHTQSSSGNTGPGTSTRNQTFYFPCLYFNTSFGDTGDE